MPMRVVRSRRRRCRPSRCRGRSGRSCRREPSRIDVPGTTFAGEVGMRGVDAGVEHGDGRGAGRVHGAVDLVPADPRQRPLRRRSRCRPACRQRHAAGPARPARRCEFAASAAASAAAVSAGNETEYMRSGAIRRDRHSHRPRSPQPWLLRIRGAGDEGDDVRARAPPEPRAVVSVDVVSVVVGLRHRCVGRIGGRTGGVG